MKNIKSHFRFTKQERSGIFFLLLCIVLLQLGYVLYHSFTPELASNNFSEDVALQSKIDALKKVALAQDSIKHYPFNPNFISDYKGYTLGLSVKEIDRLHQFRAGDAYVNSAEEFQEVTLISDSLLRAIAPYFKFPAWTQKSEQPVARGRTKQDSWVNTKMEMTDLNRATANELMTVKGIGPKLSGRIIRFRDRLGGFLVDEQLYDVYGLESEVVARALKRFKVLSVPQIEKININTATVEMLTKLIYLQRNVAIDLVNYRDSKGSIESFDELSKIENFPTEKIDRITLYLSL